MPALFVKKYRSKRRVSPNKEKKRIARFLRFPVGVFRAEKHRSAAQRADLGRASSRAFAPTTKLRSMAEDAGVSALSFEEHYERIEKKPLGEGTYGEVGAAAR